MDNEALSCSLRLSVGSPFELFGVGVNVGGALAVGTDVVVSNVIVVVGNVMLVEVVVSDTDVALVSEVREELLIMMPTNRAAKAITTPRNVSRYLV